MIEPHAGRFGIVTGTSAGIGEAVARQLVDTGWTVVGVARRASPVAHTRYHHISFDLADIVSDASRLEARIAQHLEGHAWERVGLVNNAAAPEGLMPLARLDPAELSRVYAVNAVAPVWFMGLVLRLSRPEAALRIVNVSSGAAVSAFAGLAAYGSSKAALRMAGMSLAQEWDASSPRSLARRDAAVLSYEPGVVETDMQRYARSRSVDEFPWVGMFHDFAARGIAVAPDRPAEEIVAFLESNDQPRFAERRLRA